MSFDHMRIVKAESASPIDLGRWDEKNVTCVTFDLAPYIKTYGEGMPQLAVKKPGDPKEYAAAVEREGDTAFWIVGREWLTKDGQGWCQLSWHVTDGVKKSPTYKTRVSEAMGMSTETAKEPYSGYLAQVQAAGVQAQNSAGKAEIAAGDANAANKAAQEALISAEQSATNAARSEQAAAEHKTGAERAASLAKGYTSHPPISGDNGNWWEWDGTAYRDTGKPYRGEQGARGLQGARGPQGVQGEKGDNSVVVVTVGDDDVLRLSEVGSSGITAKVENDILHVNKEVTG